MKRQTPGAQKCWGIEEKYGDAWEILFDQVFSASTNRFCGQIPWIFALKSEAQRECKKGQRPVRVNVFVEAVSK